MHISSPYPDPPAVPANEPINAFNVIFNRPDQKEWNDYTLFIEGSTGRELKYSAFRRCIDDATTALGAPESQGGLGLGVNGAPEAREDGTLEQGVTDMVGIMSENCADYTVLVNSLLAATNPYALISVFSTRFELLHALRLTRISTLFVQAKFLPLVVSAAKEVGIRMERIFVIGDRAVDGHRSLSELIEGVQRKHLQPVGVRPARKNTLAYLIFSSGTSGLPKGVMITHGSLTASMLQLARVAMSNSNPPAALPTPEGIPIGLAYLPMHHVYGLGMYCQRNFISPSTLIMMSKWNASEALQLIKKYQVTHLTLIPPVVHQLVNHPDVSKSHFQSLIAAGCGAAYLPPDLAEKFAKLSPIQMDFILGYGMTEVTFNACYQPANGAVSRTGRPLYKAPGDGTIGVLNPGMEGRILDEDGKDVHVGEVGELYLRGESMVPGYWENPTANKETFVWFDGKRWLRTGDRIRANEYGALFYSDRGKDTLKVSGSQVSPAEIENVLLAHPDKLVIDVTVGGVTPAHAVNRKELEEKVPCAWVVLSAAGRRLGHRRVIEELDKWHKESLSRYKWLRGGIEVIDEIPKNPTGKVMRRILIDAYEQKLKAKSKL
ncbi:4-coumarate- ligase [Moniliophthora roreri MCA 2997]|uniref:4-coumarate-ligase n=2 Tax=Moniliophthora roreri TaxID=221103 RepID=V2YC08_MONRO|nr:4-coumarate- ligase [Moniliophthora roreri MCA 2997]KAI3610134.1 4-coumarate-ligase [Moniliophthora roreri]